MREYPLYNRAGRQETDGNKTGKRSLFSHLVHNNMKPKRLMGSWSFDIDKTFDFLTFHSRKLYTCFLEGGGVVVVCLNAILFPGMGPRGVL
jgi:hypothetical protein